MQEKHHNSQNVNESRGPCVLFILMEGSMKIAVVGYSASGKSTFSKRLSKHYNIPVLHIDTIYFSKEMVVNDKKISEQKIYDFMKQDQWIIDGTYRYLANERYDEAEQLFIFDFNRFKCLYGVLKRYVTYRHQQRDTMAEGNPEKIDFGFIKWILWDGRKKDSKQLMKTFRTKYKDKAIRFKNRRQVNQYLKSMNIKH